MAASFTPQARKLWEELDPRTKMRVLNSVWCTQCEKNRPMAELGARVSGGDLVLQGTCGTCGHDVTRLVERG
jgi:hypothetical protein